MSCLRTKPHNEDTACMSNLVDFLLCMTYKEAWKDKLSLVWSTDVQTIEGTISMAKKPPMPGDPDILAPRFITKAEFGRRLHQLLLRKGWTQSELARRAGLPRDSISTYVRGTVFPSRLSLDKVAAALGVESESLLPNIVEGATARSAHPSFEMKATETEPGRVWLRVDRAVSFSTAAKIAALLDEDEPVAKRKAVN